MVFDYDIKDDGVVIPLKVVPGSSRSRIAGIMDHKIRIAIAAAPEKGKANKELIKFLAKTLKLSKSNIQIVSGEHDHHKKVMLYCINTDSLIDQLGALIP